MQNGGILPNWIELDPISIIVRGCPPKGMLFRKLKLLLVISDGQQEIQEKLDIFVGLSILHGIILFIQIFGPLSGIIGIYAYRSWIWEVTQKEKYQKEHELIIQSGQSETINVYLIKTYIDICQKLWQHVLSSPDLQLQNYNNFESYLRQIHQEPFSGIGPLEKLQQINQILQAYLAHIIEHDKEFQNMKKILQGENYTFRLFENDFAQKNIFEIIIEGQITTILYEENPLLKSFVKFMMKEFSIYDYCLDNLSADSNLNKFSDIQFNVANIYVKVKAYIQQYLTDIDLNQKHFNYQLYESLFIMGEDKQSFQIQNTKVKQPDQKVLRSDDASSVISKSPYAGKGKGNGNGNGKANDVIENQLLKLRILMKNFFQYYLLSQCYGSHHLSKKIKILPQYQFGNLLYCNVYQIKKIILYKVNEETGVASYLKLNYKNNPLCQNVETTNWIKVKIIDQNILQLTLTPEDKTDTNYAIQILKHNDIIALEIKFKVIYNKTASKDEEEEPAQKLEQEFRHNLQQSNLLYEM